MTNSVFPEMISQLLGDAPQISWHEEMRHDLGIPEECADEALLTLVVSRIGRATAARPIAFVVEPVQVKNTLMALTEFLLESFHPISGRSDVIAVLDYLPPLDDFGASTGIGRRWIIDKSNYQMLLREISGYVSTIASGL